MRVWIGILLFGSFLIGTTTILGNGHGKSKIKKMFRMMDKNQDNKISLEEWTAHFKEMDANKDGFLTKKEIRKHHKKMRKMMKHHEEDDDEEDED